MSKSLYKISATRQTQVWTIWGSLADQEITIVWGTLNGALQRKTDAVHVNSSGRGPKEQMILEIKSRITKQLAKGYRKTIEEAMQHVNQNALNLTRPMLAQRFDKVAGFNHDDCYRQHKYDGHRMLVHNDGERLHAYTRNGKVIDTLSHIVDTLHVPPGFTLDGEVYCHGYPLQTIASWCKREQANTLKLEYVVYDITSTQPYGDRLEILKSLDLKHPARLAHTWRTDRLVSEDLKSSIAEGYEGLILRTGRKGYSAGKRCNSLIKVKQVLDDEFLVVDVEESKDGWGILVCITSKRKEFRVSAPGTIPEKIKILNDKFTHIGRMVRIEYFSLTKDGKPFHPVAISFRNKRSE